MPYRDTASGIASLGRYGDDTLVHMNRDEVQGLQALAMAQGGSLSINPYTGLPEAFDLKGAFKKFLPTIVGGALAATGFGAPAAALAGGLAGAATSKGNLLEGFAMGALGGFGGAGLAQAAQLGSAAAPGLAGADAAKAGADAAGAGIGEAAKSGTSGLNLSGAGAGPSIPGGATMPSLSSVTPSGMPPITPGGIAPPSPSIPGTPPASGGLNLSGATGAPNVGNIPGAPSMPSISPPPPTSSTGPGGIGGKFNQFSERLADKLPAGLQDTIRNPTLGKAGIASLMSAASRAEVPKMKQGPLFRQYDFDPITREFTAREPSDTWQDPYAAGAAAGGAINNIAAQNNYLANMSRGGATDTDINSYSGEPRYAQGGMPPDMGGRFLKGPGDGVSDSIPAEIAAEGGTIPAKLAAGEFVVPARIVAEIGNGSSDAGAKELYRMLDRIEARMKKSKRGKDSGARKELVA